MLFSVGELGNIFNSWFYSGGEVLYYTGVFLQLIAIVCCLVSVCTAVLLLTLGECACASSAFRSEPSQSCTTTRWTRSFPEP
jgi:hypothetical protein